MTQTFAEGKRVPLTVLTVGRHVVLGNKTQEKDGYTAQILGVDSRKKTANKPLANFLKKVGLDFTPKNIREVRTEETAEAKSEINLAEVLTVGSTVSVTSVSKGKGTAGVMKRYGFHGGPKSHGQKDRLRAPGSIGATAPQRVIKGRKMAGHMGNVRVTVRNLVVAAVKPEEKILMVRGAVPGARGTMIEIRKT